MHLFLLVLLRVRDDVVPVAGLLQRLSDAMKRLLVDEALLVRDDLRAADHLARACLNNVHVVDGILVRGDGAGVEPDVTVAQGHDLELATIEILLVDGRDLEFTTIARLNVLGDLHHVVVVEVEPDDCVVGLGGAGLLFDRDGAHVLIELHHPVSLGIVHVIGEHDASVGIDAGFECLTEVLAVEDVVSQDERDLVVTDKFLADDERLREAFRLRLYGV